MAGIAGRASAEVKTVASKGVRLIRRVGGVVGTNAGMTVSSFSAFSLSDATSHPSRIARWVLAVLLAAATAMAVAACAASDTGTNGETTTIHHAFGTTKVKNKPDRVVTIGRDSAEVAIALGVMPVAMQKQQFGANAQGYMPWIAEHVLRSGQELPPLFDSSGADLARAVGDFHPDLILATNSGITQQQYTQLADVAPTVAFPEKAWSINWEMQIDTVAGALGLRHGGGPLIEEINRQFADAQKADWEALTLSYVSAGQRGSQGDPEVEVFLPDSTSAEYFHKLGFQIDPAVGSLARGASPGANTHTIQVSASSLPALKGSQVVAVRQPSGVPSMTRQLEVLPVVDRGAIVRLNRDALIAGTSSINPLSVPWSLGKVSPVIDVAVTRAQRS